VKPEGGRRTADGDRWQTAVAFAPASVGNMAVGFDVLGCSVSTIGDKVRARRITERVVRIAGIDGVAPGVPADPGRNTAGVAIAALMDAARPDHGFEILIEKGIPLGSGLGGSASSAVAAVVAANALLVEPVAMVRLLKCALKGEAVASGSPHADNVAPSLYGGLVLTVGIEDPIVTRIPVPAVVRCVLVHPRIELTTRSARRLLNPSVPLSDVIWQQANLAGFLTGCFTGDLRLIGASLEDVVIEPQRKALIPGFDRTKAAAIAEGALGCSISGAGPTVFAWCEEPRAVAVCDAMVDAFRSEGLTSDSWIAPVDEAGARVLERS
jgi:homoserine kinase